MSAPTLSPSTTSPAASRASRPGWRDPRLAVGIALVAGSGLLGARLLGGADDTVAVWAARTDVVAGQAVSSGDLERVRIRFADGADANRYLSATGALPEGTVLLRDVGAGELLPRAALGSADRVDLVEVAVTVPSQAVPATLAEGGVVDVWVSGRDADRSELVLPEVPVLALPMENSALGAAGHRQIIVGLDREHQRALPEALARLGGAAEGSVTVAVRAGR